MPRAWLLGAWNQGHQRLSTLADLFEVSPQAMARRLTTLGLRPAYQNRYDRVDHPNEKAA